MDFEELKTEVEKDLSWKISNCTEISTRVPLIKSKYCAMLYYVEIKLKAKEMNVDSVYSELFKEYATGNMSNSIIDRRDIPMYVAGEKKYLGALAECEIQRSRAKYLEGVLKAVDSMTFSINSAIKWEIFSNGG